MQDYDHSKIEKKWQDIWEEAEPYKALFPSDKKKFYSLIEFPYPSGAGLHVGHIRSNTAMDIISRKRRMEGYNVIYPIGWDAFGLPTENYAIKTGKNPAQVTKENTDTFRRQLKSIGFSFDWSREINTTDPEYYKWTQWIFLQFLNKGLAYKAKSYINWCLSCKVGLANEEVVDGKCERCGGQTEKREKEQWMMAITKYADRLHDDLDLVDYPDRVKIQQRNWIGKSEGSEIEFPVCATKNLSSLRPSLSEWDPRDREIFNNTDCQFLKVFTTRADTLFGATYMVIAPEHELIQKLSSEIENLEEVESYIKQSSKKSELERTAEGKEKTGVELKGIKAINPVNHEEIPVWVADYVLVDYGTGAIMAVPAHDERDRAFAEKFNLPIVDKPFVDAKKITEEVGGTIVTKYKLRDWVFSRQRYWGEPIPVIICDKCGFVPVPEKDLPVRLPEVESYQPTDTGESPLAAISDWVNVSCPTCGGEAKRETDTMPNWAGSSWYYLAYVMQGINDFKFPAGEYGDAFKYWTPIDWYNGGMEHTTLHLLYSRFWHKFLFDQKIVPTAEPYKKRSSHGMILAADGQKMSKSLGNVINPDDVVKTFGADTLRVYQMFMGPFEQTIAWNDEAIIGPRRFLERVWRLQYSLVEEEPSKESNSLIHKAIKKIGEDIENMKFNTAISEMMSMMNEFEGNKISRPVYENLLKLLAPFAPHIVEELWQNLGNSSSIHQEAWPKFDQDLIVDDKVKIAVQVNGKVRAVIEAPKDQAEDEIKALALAEEGVSKHINGEIFKIIFVKNKVINILVK